MAISTRMALSMASGVTICRAVMPRSTSSMIFIPDCFAMRILRASTAWVVAQPGRLNPSASVRQAMVLAVKSPAHEPAPGQAAFFQDG